MPHKYDTAFKLTLQHVDVAMRELVGSAVKSWKNIEFPQVRSLRADLLGETKAGELVHIELQSGNAKDMAIRMLEYGLAVVRKYHRYPTQVLLYVGEQPARMKTELRGPHLEYSYRLVDVRDLDGERLLKSGRVDDNIIGLLTRLSDHRQAARVSESQRERLAPYFIKPLTSRLKLLQPTLGPHITRSSRRGPS